MVREAQTHESEDAKKREEIDARNKLDALVYSTEKLINDNKEKLPEAELGTINDVLADAKRALEEGGKERLETAYERLTQASHQLAAKLYQTADAQAAGPAAGQGAASGAPESQASGPEEDEVIDAEYVDVDSDGSN